MTTFCYLIPETSIKHGPYSPTRMTRWYRNAYFGMYQVFIECYRGTEVKNYTLRDLHYLYGVFDPFRSEREMAVFPLLEGVPLDCYETVPDSAVFLWDHLDPLITCYLSFSQVSPISQYSRDSFYDLQTNSCPICLVPFLNADDLLRHCLGPKHLEKLSSMNRGLRPSDIRRIHGLFLWLKAVVLSEHKEKQSEETEKVLVPMESIEQQLTDGSRNHGNHSSCNRKKLPILHGSLSENKKDRMSDETARKFFDHLQKMFRLADNNKLSRHKMILLPELQMMRISRCEWCAKVIDNPYNVIGHALSLAHFHQVKRHGGLSHDDFLFWMTRLSSCLSH